MDVQHAGRMPQHLASRIHDDGVVCERIPRLTTFCESPNFHMLRAAFFFRLIESMQELAYPGTIQCRRNQDIALSINGTTFSRSETY